MLDFTISKGCIFSFYRSLQTCQGVCNVCYIIVTGQAWVERLNKAAVWFLNLFTNETTER
jgi:hypothetical protein